MNPKKKRKLNWNNWCAELALRHSEWERNTNLNDLHNFVELFFFLHIVIITHFLFFSFHLPSFSSEKLLGVFIPLKWLLYYTFSRCFFLYLLLTYKKIGKLFMCAIRLWTFLWVVVDFFHNYIDVIVRKFCYCFAFHLQKLLVSKNFLYLYTPFSTLCFLSISRYWWNSVLKINDTMCRIERIRCATLAQ